MSMPDGKLVNSKAGVGDFLHLLSYDHIFIIQLIKGTVETAKSHILFNKMSCQLCGL